MISDQLEVLTHEFLGIAGPDPFERCMVWSLRDVGELLPFSGHLRCPQVLVVQEPAQKITRASTELYNII